MVLIGRSLDKRLQDTLVSQATPFAEEEWSGHASTIELSPRQKLDVTNQIRTLRRSHPLTWSTITSHA